MYEERCRHCDGKKYNKIYFEHQNEQYYYYKKCSRCRGEGMVTWVDQVMNKSDRFCDDHPAGSMFVGGPQSKIYDGIKYIDIDSPRGKAISMYFWRKNNK